MIGDTGSATLPRLRRTFRFFSRKGVRTHGGGVMSGELKIQLRKGFSEETRVFVAYQGESMFLEVEGSPLKGSLRTYDVMQLLKKNSGRHVSLSSAGVPS